MHAAAKVGAPITTQTHAVGGSTRPCNAGSRTIGVTCEGQQYSAKRFSRFFARRLSLCRNGGTDPALRYRRVDAPGHRTVPRCPHGEGTGESRGHAAVARLQHGARMGLHQEREPMPGRTQEQGEAPRFLRRQRRPRPRCTRLPASSCRTPWT